MASKLFEYAVLYHPKPEKVDDEKVEKPSVIIVKPDWILARSDKEVAIKAARDIPTEYMDRLDLIEILVRPFN